MFVFFVFVVLFCFWWVCLFFVFVLYVGSLFGGVRDLGVLFFVGFVWFFVWVFFFTSKGFLLSALLISVSMYILTIIWSTPDFASVFILSCISIVE